MKNEYREGFFNGFIVCTVLFLGILVFSISQAYKTGQLDYQRGFVKYELTDNGYKQIIKDEL